MKTQKTARRAPLPCLDPNVAIREALASLRAMATRSGASHASLYVVSNGASFVIAKLEPARGSYWRVTATALYAHLWDGESGRHEVVALDMVNGGAL